VGSFHIGGIGGAQEGGFSLVRRGTCLLFCGGGWGGGGGLVGCIMKRDTFLGESYFTKKWGWGKKSKRGKCINRWGCILNFSAIGGGAGVNKGKGYGGWLYCVGGFLMYREKI